jgi:tetratricopeptide (TPR) repeat protein
VGSPVPPATSVGTRTTAPVAWPVRSGTVPPLTEKFNTRPESAPSFDIALERSRAIALTTGAKQDRRPADRGLPDWPAASGKTQLAVYYAESRWRDHTVELLIWLDASSRSSVLCGYVEAAAATSGAPPPGDPESIATSFLGWLEQTERRWLVVLDDLTDAGVIDGLWPEGQAGQVVITTRNPRAVAGRALCLEIGTFSRRDAMSYLVGRLSADPEQRRGAIDLIGDLDFQPLPLTQASAVIANSWTTCADYREHFTSRLWRMSEPAGRQAPPAAVTWTMAVEQADLLLPGGAVQNCLAFAALLDGHATPMGVFTTAAASDFISMAGTASAAGPSRGQPAEVVRSALSVLERVGLLTISRAGAVPLVLVNLDVQAAVRATMPTGGVQRVAAAASAALLEAWPDGEQRTMAAQMLRANAAALSRNAAELLWAGGCPPLLFRAGQSMDSAALTGPAVDYWTQLAGASERMLGPGHPDSLRLVEHLAAACQAAGRTAEAITWHRRIVDDRIRTLGSRHPLSLAALVSLGRAMAAIGDYSNAIAVLESTLTECEHARGMAHPETLRIRDELATVYLSAGQAGNSIAMSRRTLAERERAQGADNPETIATRQKLAEACLVDGRIKDALSQYRRALGDLERVSGPSDRETLRAKGALASAFHQAGRMAKAVQLYEEAKSGSEQALGPDHPDTLAACISLSRGYYAVGRIGNAADLLRETIVRCDLTLPQGDPLTKSARETLAAISAE